MDAFRRRVYKRLKAENETGYLVFPWPYVFLQKYRPDLHLRASRETFATSKSVVSQEKLDIGKQK
jgi:hypothetical protein